MANQTISADANHDAKTGRAAGEDFTINTGATLTIDSMPHLTAMGILGDITLNNGKIHIDGSRTYEVAYSSGAGGALPVVGTAISWNAGADTGKVVRLNSGDASSGVLTLTKVVGATTPDSADSITDGTWSADLDSVKIGFLIVFGEDQDWGGTSAEDLLKITGDWYEVYTGTGADDQTFELPHTGHQHGLWVETDTPGVYEIWHRISSGASTVWYDSFAEFGAHFEGGKVFQQLFGDATVTFGTSTNGGVIPNGKKVYIPNVHIGTTTVGAPTTEINSATYASHATIVPPSTTCNVEIDHLNASSVVVNFTQTNGATISDSAIGMAATFIDRCAAPVTISNCCYCCPSVNTNGGIASGASIIYTVLDHLNGLTITNSVFYGGVDASAAQSLWLQTSANVTFTGINKIVSAITDENTSVALRLTQVSNLTNTGTLICLGGALNAAAASNNVSLGTYVFGLPTGRGTTEANMNAIVATGVDSWLMSEFRVGNGTKVGTIGLFLLTDCSNVTLRGAGSPSSKVDLGARATYVASLAGISSNIRLQRLYFYNLNGTDTLLMVNSVKGVVIDNCSTDYADECDAKANDTLIRGYHVAVNAPDNATGFEGDMANTVGTCFYDHFKSDTTGAIGLLFNPPGTKHAADVSTEAGTPLWNGLADLLLRTSGDQVIYTYPYLIKGHTAFQNASIQLAGTNTTTKHSFEYSIKAIGGSWSEFDTCTDAHLSIESISPAGFYLRIRITCTSTDSTNALKGFAILTNTTLADQAANYYPLDEYTVTLTGLQTGTKAAVLTTTTETLLELLTVSGGTVSYTYPNTSVGNGVDFAILAPEYLYQKIVGYTLTAADASIPVVQNVDYGYDGAISADVTFSGTTKKIICDVGTTEIDVMGVYTEWVDWALTSDNLKYKAAFSELGGNTINAGTSVPVYGFLINSWKITPDDANHTLAVTGGIILVDGGGDPFDDVAGRTIRINYQQPVQAITVSTGGTVAPSANEIRDAIGLAAADLDDQLDAIDPPTVEEIRTEMDDNSTELAAIKGKTNLIPGLF
jgi:hypothetical protein